MAADTIAAIATPPGRGGIGVVRVSGPACADIAAALFVRVPTPRMALLANFRDANNQLIDQGLALFFPGPASFTGEDVLELQGHGGPLVMDALLTRVVELGARLARPGEFTERAFLNDKLDLAQAEAIADLIDAGSRQAASAAMRSLQGEFSARVQSLISAVVELRVYVEAAIDFSDEEIDFLAEGDVAARLLALQEQLRQLQTRARSGVVLREGLNVVIAGPPNVGKSSLLNRFAGRDTAIVTSIPGTTRDVLREYISLDGLPLHIIDTAGLRETRDPVELEGVRRAHAELDNADLAMLVVDDQQGLDSVQEQLLANLEERLPTVLVLNKCDCSGQPPGRVETPGRSVIRVSALTGAGLDTLTGHLHQVAGFQTGESGEFMARRRHLQALSSADQALQQGRRRLQDEAAGELLAEELRLVQRALAEITGEFHSEDLLGEIFASFCIGK